MAMLCIDDGRKQKVRPSYIIGELTAAAALPASNEGKIKGQRLNLQMMR